MSEKSLTTTDQAGAIEQALVMNDLSKLTTAQRLIHYKRVCESLGLNYLTQPFGYITLSGRLTLYAKKDATDQLRQLKKVSITQVEKEQDGDLYMITAYARTADGRSDVDMGAVNTKGLQGDALVNARLKAITKAKRRVTLSICGLGWLDETEVETIREVTQETTTVPFEEPEAALPSESAAASNTTVVDMASGQPLRSADELRAYLMDHAKAHKDHHTSNGQRGLVIGLLETLFAGMPGADPVEYRHEFTKRLLGVESSKKWQDHTFLALLDWLDPVTDSGGERRPSGRAQQEAIRILNAWQVEAGQTEMPV